MRVLFVTGKLAERALRDTLGALPAGIEPEVAVLGITVAALMTPRWIARHLSLPAGVDLILLPGLCQGDPAVLERALGVRTEKGPADLRRIPEHFGLAAARREYGAYDLQILAEINNAPAWEPEALFERAAYFAASGAEVIDVGCTPGQPFPNLREIVRGLRERGHRVSIDTFDTGEIETAVGAGAEIVLSVNSGNVEVARDVPATYVVLPDAGGGLETMEPTIERLEDWGRPCILDSILDPIGFGFARALGRYLALRDRHPAAEILMGTANVSELLDADTTGVNAVLAGFCQEAGIRWVLATEVIPWARGTVRELDVARRLMHYALRQGQLPKHLDDRLLTVKDAEVLSYSEEELRELQSRITDPNYRIFADEHRITVLNRDRFVTGTEIQDIFDQLGVDEATHAFYLGKELAKAKLAIVLGKTYRQEGSLSWGYLTPPDDPLKEHVRLTRGSRNAAVADASGEAIDART
ncbi:MAG: dihydropteroate synthase [Gemmatimonadetes bacterium]|nr:dihydropteroate synthase [Gemmatimonadota bacterium]